MESEVTVLLLINVEAFGKLVDENVGGIEVSSVRLDLILEAVVALRTASIGDLLNKDGDLLGVFLE